MTFYEEIRAATLKNLTAKSRIMALIFSFVLFIQVSFMVYMLIADSTFFKRIPAFAPYLAFMMILTVFSIEWLTYRHLKKSLDAGKKIKPHVPYVVTLIEISFPSIIIAFAGYIIVSSGMQLSVQLLSSPPAIMYFIMIILSSLMLDKKLCILSGLLAAVEYLLISLVIIANTKHVDIDIANQVARAAFLLLAGIIAGYVSGKIREAMLESFHARDALISRLDHLVNEKTKQIKQQKEEIEEKQKEIIDSIHYAKRIQQAIMPTDKNVKKMMDKCNSRDLI
jgi:adenylate cyclase